MKTMRWFAYLFAGLAIGFSVNADELISIKTRPDVTQLLVHHSKDACPATPFAQADQLSGRVPLIKVDGVDEKTSGPPCNSGTNHWFAGLEKTTGEEVVKWLTGKSWQRELR
jgi:hypothetical protein